MSSIRRNLTGWYTFALGVTMVVFGAALYLERRQSSVRELDQRLTVEANLAAQYLTGSQEVLGRIITDGSPPGLASSVSGYLEGIRDYLLVTDSAGTLVFSNEAAVPLNYSALLTLAGLGAPGPGAVRTGALPLDPAIGEVRYAVAPVKGVWARPGSVVVASPVSAVEFGPRQLLQAMLFIGPIILAGSVGLGYVLADRSLRPVEGMVDELEEITDGRSLHRRLAVPLNADELARLVNTMNGLLARLELSFSSLRRFTADASHELKTPLMVLRAGVERSLTDPSTPNEVLEQLDQVLDQINRMTEMVDNLLTLARADEGRAELAVKTIDLRDLVAEAAETAGILGERGGISVRVEVPKDPVQVAVDHSRMGQLLLNLVTNAIKYTPPGGKVSLGLVDQGETVALVVGDNGIGIAAADLPHIFDRFWRADVARSRTGDRPGTGLGLAITKWIAEAHGGTIAVQSRPGRGTVFTVTLPRRAPTIAVGEGEVPAT